MAPILSTEGLKINWVNYHTGLKDVYFRMDASQKNAAIYISMEHGDVEIQELYFNRFMEFRNLLHDMLQEEWIWQLHVETGDNKVISRIYRELSGVSVFNKDHWPELIPFFKHRIITLDSFWENAKYSFDGLT